jgi:hypothetical protein
MTNAVLDEARRLLNESTVGTVSSWPRAAALLARQELEDALFDFWDHHEPELRWTTNMRVKLVCLRFYAREERLAGETAWVWHALTRMTHHHPYELDPTREELASLIKRTDAVCVLLRATKPRARSSPSGGAPR